MDASSLRQAVLRRHDATGLQLRIEGFPHASPTEWQLALLFGGLFSASDGLLGPALAAWVGHITAVQDNSLTIRRPTEIDVSALDRLDDEWIALLVQLVLHRGLDMPRWKRVTGLSSAGLEPALGALVRTGLVERSTGGRFRLDTFAAQPIRSWLISREMIA